MTVLISAYLEKHPTEDGAAERINDELSTIYQKTVEEHPEKYAAFLVLLRHLLPLFKSPAILLPWWDRLIDPVLDSVGRYKGVATEALRNLLALSSLDGDVAGSNDTGLNPFADRLMKRWMEVTRGPQTGSENAEFKMTMIREALMVYGKKDPKVGGPPLARVCEKRDDPLTRMTVLELHAGVEWFLREEGLSKPGLGLA